MIFENREEAGQKLAEYLKKENLEADLVLAIPYGGLPIGQKIADSLKLPLDIITSREIGSPGEPERAIGSVTSSGVRWLNKDLIDRLEIDNSYMDKKASEQRSKALKDLRFLRGTEELPNVKHKKIILVDDGIVTESRAAACLKELKNLGAEKVIFAIPVGPDRNYENVRNEADDFIVLKKLRYFGPISAFYRDFNQLTSEEARNYII